MKLEIVELEAAVLFVFGPLLVGFGNSELRIDTAIAGLGFVDSGSGIADPVLVALVLAISVPVLDSGPGFHLA